MSKHIYKKDGYFDVVFLESAGRKMELYTTPEIIAKFAEVRRRTIDRLILVHKSDFEEFGVLRFEISKPMAGSKGGRPETIYHLNEQQATLLMTYLKNTVPVRAFKKELVRQFYLMREELARRRELRAEGKPIRRNLTDALRDSGENERIAAKPFNIKALKTRSVCHSLSSKGMRYFWRSSPLMKMVQKTFLGMGTT